MSTDCKHPDEGPNAHVRIHAPDCGWKAHIDKSFSVTAATESELAARIYSQTVKHLGYTQAPIIIGLVTELVNSLPDEIRKVVAIGIMNGWGLKLDPTFDDDGKPTGLTVSNPQVFSSLVPGQEGAPKQTRGGLILPDSADIDAIRKENS